MSQLVIEMGTLVIIQERLLTGQFCSGPIHPNKVLFVIIQRVRTFEQYEPFRYSVAVKTGTIEKVGFVI